MPLFQHYIPIYKTFCSTSSKLPFLFLSAQFNSLCPNKFPLLSSKLYIKPTSKHIFPINIIFSNNKNNFKHSFSSYSINSIQPNCIFSKNIVSRLFTNFAVEGKYTHFCGIRFYTIDRFGKNRNISNSFLTSNNAKNKFLKHESLLKLEAIRQQAELKLRCTKFDSSGNLTIQAGEFSKQELCVLHGLQPRDLRKIDSNYTNQLPSILVRNHAILINLLHIRAVVEYDCVILFDSVLSQQDFNQSVFLYELQELLKNTNSKNENLSFELRALESILILVVNSLQSEEQVLINLIQNLMAYLEESIDRTKLKELLQYSKRLSRFEQRVINIRDAIEEVLDQDEDLAGMYLTKKKEGYPQPVDHHEEVELMMETYLKQVEEIANAVESTSSQLKTTEDVVNIILDSQRNSLMMLDIRLAVLTVALAVGTFISSLFGMNLISGFEEHPLAFYITSAIALTLVCSVVGACFFKIIKTLKRLN
ncbi:hypothetical protein BB561_002252 [Smittium simulii]|uniref:Magnesium transporter n=1 Tax=Smittium simulii TaxID=133385 RepID=A0A2T9YR52_9FUNG|nr:hypothetical protein BB561_002252 [Smittium simulii]